MDTIKKYSYILSIPLFALIITGCSLTAKQVTDAGIFYSQNEGETWVQRVFVEQQKKKALTLGSQNVRFFVFHPQEESTVYASMESGLFISRNKGEDWDKAPLSGVVSALIYDPSTPNIQYAATGGRILKTVDDGKTWTQVYTDRPGATVTALAIHKNNTSKIWAGNSDGSILLSEDFGNTWSATVRLSEPVLGLVISDTSTASMYALLSKAGFAISNDGGSTWDEKTVAAALKEFKQAIPLRSFSLRPGTNGDIVIASQYGILRTTNGGQTWVAIPTVIPFNTTPINDVVIHPTNQSKIYFTAAQIFYASTDGGETWKTHQTVPTSQQASKLDINPNNPDDLYIGITKNVK